MSENKTPPIVEKVLFWEEQDHINQALIPRVIEMHDTVSEIQRRTANISEEIAAVEARTLQRTLSACRTPAYVRVIAVAALVIAVAACAISLYQLLA